MSPFKKIDCFFSQHKQTNKKVYSPTSKGISVSRRSSKRMLLSVYLCAGPAAALQLIQRVKVCFVKDGERERGEKSIWNFFHQMTCIHISMHLRKKVKWRYRMQLWAPPSPCFILIYFVYFCILTPTSRAFFCKEDNFALIFFRPSLPRRPCALIFLSMSLSTPLTTEPRDNNFSPLMS